MRYIIAACAAIVCGCAAGDSNYGWGTEDAGDGEAGPTLELVCGPNFCGTMVDKNTGITANCGDCPDYAECGDNNIPNVCGSACVPTQVNGTFDTAGCNFAYGPAWWAEYATAGVQISGACNYVDKTYCAPQIYNPWPPNGVCSGTVCGAWWCCLYQPDAGINPLQPNAVANNDGGLP